MSEDEREPPYLYPDYVGTRLRAPAKPLVQLPNGFHDFPAPLFPRSLAELDYDLTRQHSGEPIGERIIVTGRLLDSDGRPVTGTVASGSNRETSRSRPAWSGIDCRIGSRGINGSPGKYIWVTSRLRNPLPKSEKWICAGRHALRWFFQG